MRRNLHIPALAVIALMVTSLTLGGKSRTSAWDARADELKADYIYMEGMRYRALGNNAAYYELTARASELNPADLFVAKENGLGRLLSAVGDSAATEEAIVPIAQYARNNPDDFYANASYAQIAGRLGMIDEALDTWRRLYDNNPDRPELGLLFSDQLARTGESHNLGEALTVLDRITESEGINPDVSSRKMRIFLALGDTASIMREGKALLNSSPSNIDYNVFLGQLMMNIGRPDSARTYFDRAVAIDPSSGLAYYHRANYYSEIGDSVAYDREVFQALQQPDLDMLSKLGILNDYVRNLYTDSLQQPRINQLFATLIDQYPHEADVRDMYSEYLLAVRNYPAAAEQMSYALDIKPDNEKSWLILTSIYGQLKDYKRALDAANSALHYFPRSTDMLQLAASVASADSSYATALDYLDRALQCSDSTDVEARSNLIGQIGDTYYASGQPDTAFIYYDKAIKLNPENLSALNNCAYFLACQEMDLDRALKMIEHVVNERPEDATSLDTYAWVLFKRKDYVKAKEVIDGALANTDDDDLSAEILEHAGDIYFMAGEPDAALDFWHQALTIDPDNTLLAKKVKNKTFFYK